MTHTKITDGYVVQAYDGTKCTSQAFVAGDTVEYEDEFGNAVDVDVNAEEYQPFHMVQPILDYYYLQIWGCVEAIKFGPFCTEEQRDTALEKQKETDGEDRHSYHTFELPQGIEIEF